MRFAAFALVSACALAACNPSAPSGNAGGAFPDLTHAAYRAEAQVRSPDGNTLPVVMIRSGNKIRMEMASPQGGQMAVINNGETGDRFILMTNNGRTSAMQMNNIDYKDPAEEWGAEFAATATRVGSCAVAGESGAEWTRQVNDQARTTCVTDDGIILRATEGDQTTWETTSVQRGPQSADLFVVPPGVTVTDVSAIASEAANAAVGGHISPQLCEQMRNGGAPADVLARAGCS
jgi:hypothetical protein